MSRRDRPKPYEPITRGSLRLDRPAAQQTETGRYESWWYDYKGHVHLVSLALRAETGDTLRSPWVVTYVGW